LVGPERKAQFPCQRRSARQPVNVELSRAGNRSRRDVFSVVVEILSSRARLRTPSRARNTSRPAPHGSPARRHHDACAVHAAVGTKVAAASAAGLQPRALDGGSDAPPLQQHQEYDVPNRNHDQGSQGDTSRSKGRGFAGMDAQQQRQIASAGGRAAHASGHAHEFTSEEARQAGRKGGEARSQRSRAGAGSDRDIQDQTSGAAMREGPQR
jgi:general stress protein YciG